MTTTPLPPPPPPPPPPATLDRDGIAARIPHAGSMCLLDALDHWDADGACCRASRSHHDPANPLRSPGGLLSVVAVEYAAQAMALHGALTAAAAAAAAAHPADGAEPAHPAPRPGFLAAARALNLQVPRLDDIAGDLIVRVQRHAASGSQALYHFQLHDSAGRTLADGRATVVLDTPLAPAFSQPHTPPDPDEPSTNHR